VLGAEGDLDPEAAVDQAPLKDPGVAGQQESDSQASAAESEHVATAGSEAVDSVHNEL